MGTRETATVEQFVLWADWLIHGITWSTRKTWSLKSLEINIWHFNTFFFFKQRLCVEIYLELKLDKRLHVIILVELENRN